MAERPQFDRLAIRRFRGIEDLELSGLGEVNILLGANDVGKTSILEAVILIADPAEPRRLIKVQNRRGHPVRRADDLASVFLDLDFSREAVIEARTGIHVGRRKLEISASDMEYSIDVDDDLEFHGRRVLNYRIEFQNSSQEIPRSSHIELVHDGNTWGEGDKSHDEVTVDKIKANLIIPTSGYDAGQIGRLVVNKKDQLLVDYLQHINPRVAKISVLGNMAYLDIGLAQMMPLNMFGSGMVRTAMILSECMLRDSKILLIDELEQGLHYQAISFLLEALLRLAKEQGIQVFATTHSIEVIKGLQQVLGQEEFTEYRDTTKCITLQRDKDGIVRSYRYDYQQFDHCIEHGIEIR